MTLVEKLRIRFLWAPTRDHRITSIPWCFYLICPYLVNIIYSFTLNSWSGGQSPYLNEVCLASCLWKACHNSLLLETLDCSSRLPSTAQNWTTWNDSCMIQDLKQKADSTGDVLWQLQYPAILRLSINIHNNATSLDCGTTNQFQWLGDFVNIDSLIKICAYVSIWFWVC